MMRSSTSNHHSDSEQLEDETQSVADNRFADFVNDIVESDSEEEN